MPEELGVNVTLIWQLPPAGSPSPQLFVSPNSALATIEVMFKVPFVLRVTTCGELVVPTDCKPKFKLGGVNVTTGAIPVPDNATV